MATEVTKQSAYQSQYTADGENVTKQSAYATFFIPDLPVTKQTAYVTFYPKEASGRRRMPFVIN